MSLHSVGGQGHVPLALRLFLPESWLEAPARLDQAGVPAGERRALTKGEIALELLDAVRAEHGLPGQVVVADSGYGVSGPLRAGLAARGLHYVLGVTGEMVVFTEEPRWLEPGPRRDGRPGGRARHRYLPASDGPRPLSLRAVAAQTPLRRVTRREGTKGAMGGPLRLAARVARPRLDHRRLRGRGTALAAHRGTTRGHDQGRLQQPARRPHAPAGRAPVAGAVED